jgi:hypothetical protein
MALDHIPVLLYGASSEISRDIFSRRPFMKDKDKQVKLTVEIAAATRGTDLRTLVIAGLQQQVAKGGSR